jgi:predicted glycogen debranching enzyme
VDGIRTRRYHALLLHASTPPTSRHVLVNGIEAWLEWGETRLPVSSQRYSGGAVTGPGAAAVAAFAYEPWPRWTLSLPGDITVLHEVFVPHAHTVTVLRWRVQGAPAGARLALRPLLSGRDMHALQWANDAFRFETERIGAALRWQPYAAVPGVLALGNGEYEHAPDWYWRFFYTQEAARGLDREEDLASPGVLRFDVSSGEAVLLLGADVPAVREMFARAAPAELADELAAAERARRAAFVSPLHRSADAYIVARGAGRSIIAGYPWFGEWGRDAFVALRGLCLATGRLDDARDILIEWSGAVSGGMVPNRFPDAGDTPEYNSVDASLWYVVVAGEWLDAMAAAGRTVAAADATRLREAIVAILEGYAGGTRYGIHASADGLLACGEPGTQLTWMDAKLGDWVVTPRVGKPVEVQALWVNALDVGARFAPRWALLRDTARAAFLPRFWNEARGCLYDVVDVDHVAGTHDAALRPNQLFAIGGLPLALVDGERAQRVLALAESQLLTPLGPRSLAPGEPGYTPRADGELRSREGAYHQGTVWPWLMGAFVEGWLRARGGTDAAKAEARERFLAPLRVHLEQAGLGHVSEIADAESPHTPHGCPFQAWSLGELLRLELSVLADTVTPRAAG